MVVIVVLTLIVLVVLIVPVVLLVLVLAVVSVVAVSSSNSFRSSTGSSRSPPTSLAGRACETMTWHEWKTGRANQCPINKFQSFWTMVKTFNS